MNQRIRELESQCWEPRQYGPAWFNSEKFAELIVAECAGIYDKIDNGNQHQGTDDYLLALQRTFRS